jgi:hypothetical protein
MTPQQLHTLAMGVAMDESLATHMVGYKQSETNHDYTPSQRPTTFAKYLEDQVDGPTDADVKLSIDGMDYSNSVAMANTIYGFFNSKVNAKEKELDGSGA